MTEITLPGMLRENAFQGIKKQIPLTGRKTEPALPRTMEEIRPPGRGTYTILLARQNGGYSAPRE